MADWTTFRRQFPALEGRVYMNTAAGGPVSARAASAAMRYYEEAVVDADTAWDRWLRRLEADRADVADWIGAAPKRLSFLPNTSLGLNIVARSFEDPVHVLAVDQEFPSCTYPFIRAGHRIEFIPTSPDGRITPADLPDNLPENLPDTISPSKRILVLSSVQYANGFRADLEAIGTWCREHDVYFVVDATQSVSAFPLDMERQHIDWLVFSGYKWATGGYGNAVLAAGDRVPDVDPPLVGWRSASDAYEQEVYSPTNDRLNLIKAGIGHEMGHPLFPTAFALAEAVRVMREPGIDSVAARILALTDALREGLAGRDVTVRSASDRNARSGITLVDVNGSLSASDVAAKLKDRDVFVSARDKGLRVSVHAYNSTRDVESFLKALDEVLADAR